MVGMIDVFCLCYQNGHKKNVLEDDNNCPETKKVEKILLAQKNSKYSKGNKKSKTGSIYFLPV